MKVYPLEPGQVAQIKTATQRGSIVLSITFSDGTNGYVSVQCTEPSTNTWTYLITNCSDGYTVLSEVPASAVKVWTFTPTLTHFILECNGASVLNFNYATSGRRGCQEDWGKEITGRRFYSGGLYNNTGLQMVQIAG